MKDHQHLMNDFHRTAKSKKWACKALRVSLKNEERFKIFKKFLSFFDQNLYGKLTFFTFVTKYFLDFLLISESIYLWKLRSDFCNNFPIWGGGTFRRSAPPDATGRLTSPSRNRKNCCRNLVFFPGV